MTLEKLKTTFFSLVAPDLPNDWDVEEAVQNLVGMDELHRRSVFDQVPVIWPISHSLCFDYLRMAATALDCIEVNYLSQWVNRTLDQYEKNGLRAAQRFMSDVEENFLCSLRGETGLQFGAAERRLAAYLKGLGGRDLEIAQGEYVFTDTSSIFLPGEITRYQSEAENFFLYKLIVTYQWAFIHQGTFTVQPDGQDKEHADLSSLWLQDFLNSFSNSKLAGDIYHFLETVRISTFLTREFPGLMRRCKEFLKEVYPAPPVIGDKSSALCILQQGWASNYQMCVKGSCYKQVIPVVQRHQQDAKRALDSIDATRELYDNLNRKEKQHIPLVPFIFQGTMNLEAVKAARAKRIEEAGQKFVEALATRILSQAFDRRQLQEESAGKSEGAAGMDNNNHGVALVVHSQKDDLKTHADKTFLLTINNEEVTPGEELEQAAADIIRDLGYLPEKYISSATGKAGSGYPSFAISDPDAGPAIQAPITYDEWDYRRGDFRKDWCSVREKEIPLSRSSFLEETISRYHGQIVRLRYQFEMMRNRERFVRRQRDGEDIDLDAMVESMADVRAGLPPTDRLFVRLRRDERDIAVVFLVDMSNSTQGWVGRVIKESLVLMCEALEVVGDRYAVYGFSGMRRLRCDFFHIKHLDEPYDVPVKERISSLAPREYTRMAPAVRHAVSQLRDVDARVKLLVTLSDGKPEDYDDYKGEYAIQDTRHALIEAKQAGVHPFCITIDKHARDYIEHMYSDVNYIRIDDAGKLPLKMPEIYRILTQ